MEKQFTETQLAEVASQLSCPSGTGGVEMAGEMHKTNISMTLKAIETMTIADNDVFLELGHGNAAHLNKILEAAQNVSYQGLDISELMNEEAQKLNEKFVQNKQASFQLYDGTNLPYADATFSKIMTVNTLYFWQEPAKLLSELYRVLKPKGRLSIAFTQKESMERLPFTKYGFTMYDTEKVKGLVAATDFKIADIANQYEKVKSKLNKLTERNFTVITLEK